MLIAIAALYGSCTYVYLLSYGILKNLLFKSIYLLAKILLSEIFTKPKRRVISTKTLLLLFLKAGYGKGLLTIFSVTYFVEIGCLGMLLLATVNAFWIIYNFLYTYSRDARYKCNKILNIYPLEN